MSASVLATSTRAPGAPRPVVAATAGLVVHTLVGPAPAAARAGRAGVGEAVLFAAWAALLAGGAALSGPVRCCSCAQGG
jgi:hypothetical protein